MFSPSRHLFLTVGTLSNQVIGYCFVRVLAQRYGTSLEKASFDIAYSVPFVIMSLTGLFFLQGLLTAHFSLRSEEEAQQDFSTLSTLLLGFSLISVGLLYSARFAVAEFLAPGLPEAGKGFVSQLMLAFSPLVLVYALFTLLSSVLLARNVPIEGDLCSFVSRSVMLGVLLLGPKDLGLESIAWGLSLAGVVALIFGCWILQRATEVRLRFFQLTFPERMQALLKQSGGFVLAAVLAQAAFAGMRAAISYDSPSAVAAFGYAMMIIGPAGLLVGKPLAYAFGPQYLSAEGQGEKGSGLGQILLRAGLASLIIMLFCYGLSERLIRLLFGGGAFDEAAVLLTTGYFQTLLFSLPALILMWILLFPLLGRAGRGKAAWVYGGGSAAHLILSIAGYLLGGGYGACLGYVAAMYLQLTVGLSFFRPLQIQKPILGDIS